MEQQVKRALRLIDKRYASASFFVVIFFDIWVGLTVHSNDPDVHAVINTLLPLLIIGLYAIPAAVRIRQESLVKWLINDGLIPLGPILNRCWVNYCKNKCQLQNFLNTKDPSYANTDLSSFLVSGFEVDVANRAVSVLWLYEIKDLTDITKRMLDTLTQVDFFETEIYKAIGQLGVNDSEFNVIYKNINDYTEKYLKLSDCLGALNKLHHELLPLAIRDIGLLTDSIELVDGGINEVVKRYLNSTPT